MVLSLSLPCIILLLSKYSTLCSLCQSFRNRNPKAQSNSPSRKGGVLLRSAFARGATKGVGGQSILSSFIFSSFSPLLSKFFQLEKTYPRKRNKPLQSNDFSSLCLSVRKKNFEVVSNTSGRRFLNATAQSPTFAISFPNPAFHF